MNKLPPIGSPERDYVVDRLLNDTGFYCRYVLGMDTDRDENGNCTSEIGKGGVRDYGPHQEVISFLDDETPGNNHRILMAPRYSYKSSMLRGFVQRKIIAHPNISILLVMHEMEMARQRCLEIREDLENNPILQELFPNMRGHLWKGDKFITGLRTDKAGDSPTLFIASPKKPVTGARPNLVVFDDIVSDQDLTENSLARSRRCVEKSLLLGARGCTYIDVGTPYHYADAHHWCMEQPGWKKCVHLDVGYDLMVNDDKSLDLKGEGRWPNLSKEFLRDKLRGGVSFPTFMSQYKLQVVAGTYQAFHRHHFQSCSWREEFQDLTGYLLTDIAQGTAPGASSSERGSGALNVLMYVGVDARNRVYVLDCQVGRWTMFEFCERYLAILDKWSGRVNHRAEVWEQVHSNTAYASYLGIKCKERNRRPQICWQTRNGSEINKVNRINATQVRFQANEVFVCNDTMPRTWLNDTEVRELWNPEGFTDIQKNAKLPGGDFVEQFIRFPHHPLKDIPDAFSLVDAMDKETGQRVCFYMRPSRQRISESEQRKPVIQNRAGSAERFYARVRGQRGSRN